MHSGINKSTKIVISFFYAIVFLPMVIFAEDKFSITSSTQISQDGTLSLSWEIPSNYQIELQKKSSRTSEKYITIYRGHDTSTVLTGLSNGQYSYRARLINSNGSFGQWTENLNIQVQHHPLTRAFSFFFIGLIVFLGIISVIYLGNKAHDKEADFE
ncbi:MAG: hypothetical protein HQL46_06800 [Gammaproteobacteria bacterium]|nr:hypothetical protein [Gammaproteobacteria bacterium]